MASLILSLAILATIAEAGPCLGHCHDAAKRGWTMIGELQANEQVELTFAVRQRNLRNLSRVFSDVSNPSHTNYGKHLSWEDVNALVAPSAEDVGVVEETLRILGAVNVKRTPNSDFITCEAAVAAVQNVFSGTFQRFQHKDGRIAVRNAGALLPSKLSNAVDFISPLAQPLSSGGPLKVQTGNSNSIVNTPSSLRKLYNVGSVEGKAAGNKQAVTGFLEQHYTNVDLQEFFTLYYRKGLGRKISKAVGDQGSGMAGTEAELDVQYSMSMGGNVTTEFWGFAGRAPNSTNEPFLKWLLTLSNTSDAPLILSTSYGEDEDSVDKDYADRCNVEFQKAGARGISLLFASGDSGVGGDSHCGIECEQGKECFVPMWPAASPYVTAVGGTGGDKEVAAGLSSGGFSYRWPVPTWQKAAVESFLAGANLPNRNLFSKSGRGFPDISAQALNFMVVTFGIPMPVAGTSCASPTAAGIFSLVNDVRLQAGKPPLGFMNPLLYANAGSLNDVTGGNNPGCGSAGFHAVPGWDPVTGLGTPNYPKLAELALTSARQESLLVV